LDHLYAKLYANQVSGGAMFDKPSMSDINHVFLFQCNEDISECLCKQAYARPLVGNAAIRMAMYVVRLKK
jgi:hypothetical protein